MADRFKESVDGLVELGFTRLEAEVYTALCRRSPMTGYGIAQAVGKPVANTYKAVESLRARGAVITDDGESRLCRAVPPDELLANLDRSFRDRKERIAQSLSQVGSPDNDTRVYALGTAEQTLERGRSMLQNCKEVVLIDAFPAPLEALKSDIEAAARRKVLIAVKAYAPVKLPGAEVIQNSEGRATQKRWPGQWLNIVADGSEHLLAFLTADMKSVHQSVWSESPYLSWIYHCAVAGEMMQSALRPLIERGSDAKTLRKALQRYQPILALQAPGYKKLLKQFQGDIQ